MHTCWKFSIIAKLYALDELNEHSIGVRRDDAPNAFPERLRLPREKLDALAPQSRRCRINVRYAERYPV